MICYVQLHHAIHEHLENTHYKGDTLDETMIYPTIWLSKDVSHTITYADKEINEAINTSTDEHTHRDSSINLDNNTHRDSSIHLDNNTTEIDELKLKIISDIHRYYSLNHATITPSALITL